MAAFPSASDRRQFLKGAAAGCALLPWLAACGRNGADGMVVLGDQVHLSQTKLEAAGQLANVPYRITWANFPGAAPLLEALNAGAVDTAPAGDLPIVLAAAAGCRLRIAAVTRSKPQAMAIIVPKDSPIRTVAQLKGQTVIVSSARGSISHYLLLEALREAGVVADAVKIAFMLPNDAAAAFATGQITAWATFGVYQARAEQAGARILRDGSGIGPGYSAIAVSEAALASPNKRKAIAEFLVRSQRASIWCRENPAEYARLYARQTGLDLATAQLLVGRENPGLLRPDAEFVTALQSAADRFYRDYRMLPRAVDVAALIEPGLLEG